MIEWMRRLLGKKENGEVHNESEARYLFRIGGLMSWFPEFDPGSGTQRVMGFGFSKPRVGDYLEVEMKSGRTGIYEFTEVKPMMDPRDQFFATVKPIGYDSDVDMDGVIPPYSDRPMRLL